MTLALRAANAVAETRLKAAAMLIAAGVPEDCIGYWTHNPMHPREWSDGGVKLCGVTVCGLLAAEVACWREDDGRGDVVVNLSWYGSAQEWVPSQKVLRMWRSRAETTERVLEMLDILPPYRRGDEAVS